MAHVKIPPIVVPPYITMLILMAQSKGEDRKIMEEVLIHLYGKRRIKSINSSIQLNNATSNS